MSDQVCRHGGLARKCEQCEQEQAASELRQAALDGQAALDERDAEITRLRAENERLRDHADELAGQIVDLRGDEQRLRTWCDRLEIALGWIANSDNWNEDDAWALREIGERARAALEGTP